MEADPQWQHNCIYSGQLGSTIMYAIGVETGLSKPLVPFQRQEIDILYILKSRA